MQLLPLYKGNRQPKITLNSLVLIWHCSKDT